MQFPFVSRARLTEALSRQEELLAEFKNYRRRNEDLAARSADCGARDAICALLPVYDDLTRALAQPCSDEAYAAGIALTMQNLKNSMEKLGIEEIPALGCSFDPNLHEAMEHIEDPEQAENIITQVVLTGFCRNGTILRHALVVVAN